MKKNSIIKNKSMDVKSFNFNLIMIISCAVIFSLIIFALTPLYVHVASDIVISVTFIPLAVELVLDILDILAFVICYSLIIYSAVTRHSAKTFTLCGIYISACLVRRIATLIMTFITDGVIGGNDILSVVVYFLLEAAQAVIVTAIASGAAKKYHKRAAEMEKAARRVGDSSNYKNLEFTQVYSKNNPLQSSALKVGILLSAVKILTRVIYDISYGAPTSASEVLTMVIYYFSDMLICVVFYALCWLIFSKLYKRDTVLTKEVLQA